MRCSLGVSMPDCLQAAARIVQNRLNNYFMLHNAEKLPMRSGDTVMH